MIERDVLVAAISIGLGFCILYTLIANQQRCFDGPIGKRMAERYGKNEARGILFGVSMLVIFLGFYILATAFWPRTERANSLETEVQSPPTRVSLSPATDF